MTEAKRATVENNSGLFEGEIREQIAGKWRVTSAIIAYTNAEVLQFFYNHGIKRDEITV